MPRKKKRSQFYVVTAVKCHNCRTAITVGLSDGEARFVARPMINCSKCVDQDSKSARRTYDDEVYFNG